MNSGEIRDIFLKFFESKGHKIVPSAPIVVKNDPTLMFTNAGMNQFKDFFLGNQKALTTKVVDTQKCLRVSGKHNDLEEVGVDHYHHTMFEMLGNWSFGDYFKKEAIVWAWELLTEKYKLNIERLYVTVFEGDETERLNFDADAFGIWKGLIDESRILKGNKKDNFWEMGETGPCGPCSEIHIDMRPDLERAKLDGAALVNTGHPEVIEIWNLVFMEFNRKADGTLEPLPDKHVDTGMGFERLTRALQGKNSNYDTDIFSPIIKYTESLCGLSYNGTDSKPDIAFRVIADHIRAISFCIADGQLPSNNGAGYVIRRILRRAVRYGYSFLNLKEPFLCKLVPHLANDFKSVFPELAAQEEFVARVIQEEETTFLKTLSKGLEILHQYFKDSKDKIINGKAAFELYDTFGFPIDLTELIATENGFVVDREGFEHGLLEQKTRSRQDAKKETGDWMLVSEMAEAGFVGYDLLETHCFITRYRTVKVKDKNQYQLVLNTTPFYAESGGQVGDKGVLSGSNGEIVNVIDTQKENDLIIHIVNKLPNDFTQSFVATVSAVDRNQTACNHTATHLLHAALRTVLGTHVSQKGSLVCADYLRFDFSHFAKLTQEELYKVETLVNSKIRQNIALDEKRNIPIAQATQLGAMALFGEKYGDFVRVITFDPDYSVELCGGTHVQNTAEIGLFSLLSESSVAAGVRRIEAVTSQKALEYINSKSEELKQIKEFLGNPSNAFATIKKLSEENSILRKKVEQAEKEKVASLKKELVKKVQQKPWGNLILEHANPSSTEALKDIAFQLKNELDPLVMVLVSNINEKAFITIVVSESLVQSKGWNAGSWIKEWSRLIQGGGGGQPFFATSGGKDLTGLDAVLSKARETIC